MTAGRAGRSATANVIAARRPRDALMASGRSQSPAVDSTMWSAPRAQSSAATSARSSAAAAAKRSRSLRVRVSTLDLAARLGIDEPSSPTVGQLQLARVADLDREHVVAGAQLAQRRRASRAGRGSRRRRRSGRALRAMPPARRQRRAERGRRPPSRRPAAPRAAAMQQRRAGRGGPGAAARQRLAAAEGDRRPGGCRAGSRRGRPRARRPRRRRPCARSAVPKPIEAESSNISHVVSARSATCTRTCGSRMRAVTFQSIWRTSSPGWYGRTCASSMPPPMPRRAVLAGHEALDPARGA